MKEERMVSILKNLSKSEYVSSKKLAAILELSSKTILNEIKELNQLLEPVKAYIEVKPKRGCKLVIGDEQAYSNFLSVLELPTQKLVPVTPDQRIQYLLVYLLETEKWVKIEQLCEKFYISQSSLSKDLKEVRKYLACYSIQLESRPNYGLKIKGSEFDIRLCLVSIINDKDVALFYKKEDNIEDTIENLAHIKKILDQIFEETNFQIADISYQNLVFHIFTSLNRILRGHRVMLVENQLNQIKSKKEFFLAKRIMEEAYKLYGLDFKNLEEESAYIAIHLEAKRTIGFDKLNQNVVISDGINETVSLMLEEVKKIYYIDFFDDFDLRMMLALHLVPFNTRMEYDLVLRNPLLKDIKTQYTYAFNLAVVASDVLRQHFGKMIEEEEIGYFALHFNLALERKKKVLDKKNILIVCGTGRGTAQLLLFRFQENFGKYLDVIDTCDVLSVKNKDFSKIDYVVTTVPLTTSIPVPILEIKSLMGETDIKKVHRFLTKGENSFVEKYFTKDLFFSEVEVSTKEEAIQYMVNKIQYLRADIPTDFYKAILKREKQATTEFGNLIAIPHPWKAMSEDTFVCVCILKKPIIWNEKKVQLIYMTSMETNSDRDLMIFYKVTSKLLVNRNYVEEIIQRKSFDFMIKLLKSIEDNLD